MPKQLAFEKAERNRCAVDLYKRMTLARAHIVNCAGDHFFASTRLALYEDRRIRRRNDSNALEHGFQRLTISDDLFEIVLKADFVFQVERLLRQAIPGFRYLLVVQSILYADGYLRRYLCKESDVGLAEGILLLSAHPGVVTEQIQVVASAPLVESTSAELGTVVTEEKISD